MDKPLEIFLGLRWYHANLELYLNIKEEILKKQSKLSQDSAMTCKMLKINIEELDLSWVLWQCYEEATIITLDNENVNV